jgi:hypothetical protein
LQICEYSIVRRNNFAINSDYSPAAHDGLCHGLLSGLRPVRLARESSIRT